MDRIKIDVEEIYNNLILTAISRKQNFAKLVKEAEKETNNYIEDRKNLFLPRGYAGLYFIELLARKMGSSLGEVYNLSEIRREEIVRNLLLDLDPIGEAYANYYDEDEEQGFVEFQGVSSVVDVSDQKEIMLYYVDLLRGEASVSEHDIYTYYRVTFRKGYDEDNRKAHYSISIGWKHKSDYMYDGFEVWEGYEGYFADFIEKVILDYKEKHAKSCDMNDKNGESEAKTFESTNKGDSNDNSSTIKVKKPVIESQPIQEGPKIIDELVTYIWDDTRTIDLLDKFEGYGQSDPIRYKRIVIKNTNFNRYTNKHRPGFNLVIERGHGSDYVGDVTFTEFKKGKTLGLARHIATEVTDEVIEQYVDKDQFYRFSKPFLLRAQNSSNRTGYGWEWDWSGGYGDYTEGTLYGETTNYFFVGVYVTTGYSYESSKRQPFVGKMKKEEEPTVAKTGGKIVYYKGKLNSITKNKIVQRHFKIETSAGSVYIPVSFDETENVYYIAAGNSQKYGQAINNGHYEVMRSISL